MKTLSKIEYVRRFLNDGKAITNRISVNLFNYFRLSDAIYKIRKSGMWIINIGEPGKFAKYIKLERGRIKNLILKGFRFDIIDAHYINGYADMEIYLIANNGLRSVNFTVNSDAFRDKKIMIGHLNKALK